MNEEWLAGLKPGDEVFVAGGYYGCIGTVTRRTPGGQFLVTTQGGEFRFSPAGLELTAARYRRRIQPMTPENCEALERARLLARIGTARWADLPTDALRRIRAIVEEAGESPNA